MSSVYVVRFGIDIIVKSMLSIGKGQIPISPHDVIIQKKFFIEKGKELPYIPGSSIKGILRTLIARIAPIFNEFSCMNISLEENPEEFIDPDDKHGKICDPSNPCRVCKLFGTKNLQGRVFIDDAIPKDNQLEIEQVYKSTRIDRVLNTTAKGALWRREFVLPNTKFSTNIYIRLSNNIIDDDKDIALILIGLYMIKYDKFGRHGIVEIKLVDYEPKDLNFWKRYEKSFNILKNVWKCV